MEQVLVKVYLRTEHNHRLNDFLCSLPFDLIVPRNCCYRFPFDSFDFVVSTTTKDIKAALLRQSYKLIVRRIFRVNV